MSLNTAYGRQFVALLGSFVDLSHPLARGLIGAWLFNENAGLRVSDGGQRHYDGVVTGGTWVGGARGPALLFNGSTDVVTVANPSDSSLSLLPEITILGWIRPGTAQTGNILNKDGNSGYRYRINTGRTITWLMQGGNQITSVGTAPGDVWSHIAVSADSVGLKIYINGVLDTFGGGGISNTPADAGQALLFGFGAFGEVYSGAINEHYLYRRALTAAEILWHYREPLALYPVPNYRRWSVPERRAIDVADSSTVTESVLFSFNPGLSISISVNETVTITDSPNLLIINPNQRAIQVSDSLTVAEHVTAKLYLSVSVSDLSMLTEDVTLIVPRSVEANETATVTESVTVRLSVSLNVFESSTVSESVAVGLIVPPAPNVADTVVLAEGVTIHLGVDAVHTITIIGSLDAFDQIHTIRILPALMQGLSDRDIQKPVGQLIRT